MFFNAPGLDRVRNAACGHLKVQVKVTALRSSVYGVDKKNGTGTSVAFEQRGSSAQRSAPEPVQK